LRNRVRRPLDVQSAYRASGFGLDDVSLAGREATVTGKGDKQRTVRFTYDTSRALDLYSRDRPNTQWRESRRCGSACAAAR
jgi:site-specific recombinase XerC